MNKNLYSKAKLRVLILDDDLDYRNYCSEWVKDLGFYPIPVGKLPDAQSVLENQVVDIAIIDLFLGDRSEKINPKGLLLLRDIINIDDEKRPFVIVVTGDPRGTPRLWEEITDYMKRGIVIAIAAKENKQFQEKLQSELDMIARRIFQQREIRESTRLNGSLTASLRVFLCHFPGDKVIVRRLYDRLKSEENIDPWIDDQKILPGQDWDLEIQNALRQSDVIVICCSIASVKMEGYVQKEIKKALDIAEEKPEEMIFIIPLRLDECVIPQGINRWQSVDFFEKDGYKKLLQSLNHRAGMLVK